MEEESTTSLNKDFILRLLGEDEEKEILEEVILRYSEKGRHYHTIKHINACLEELSRMEKNSSLELGDQIDLLPMVYAILFHDAIYNPKAKDEHNVKMSAELWKSLAEKAGVADWVVDKTYSLIMATNHKTRPDNLHEKLMADIDLAILGKEKKIFFDYNKGIRKEYSWVSWDVFREKRAHLLESIRGRDHIYNTFEFRNLYESRARENLESCLEQLRDPDSRDYLLSDQ